MFEFLKKIINSTIESFIISLLKNNVILRFSSFFIGKIFCIIVKKSPNGCFHYS